MTAQAVPDHEADFHAAIRKQCDHFGACFARGDILALVEGYYTDDPCIIAADQPYLTGREAVRNILQGLANSGVKNIKLETVRATVDGNLGYEVGRATLTVIKDGAPVTMPARYLVTWKKGDDGWRVDADMFGFGEI